MKKLKELREDFKENKGDLIHRKAVNLVGLHLPLGTKVSRVKNPSSDHNSTIVKFKGDYASHSSDLPKHKKVKPADNSEGHSFIKIPHSSIKEETITEQRVFTGHPHIVTKQQKAWTSHGYETTKKKVHPDGKITIHMDKPKKINEMTDDKYSKYIKSAAKDLRATGETLHSTPSSVDPKTAKRYDKRTKMMQTAFKLKSKSYRNKTKDN